MAETPATADEMRAAIIDRCAWSLAEDVLGVYNVLGMTSLATEARHRNRAGWTFENRLRVPTITQAAYPLPGMTYGADGLAGWLVLDDDTLAEVVARATEMVREHRS